jgi:hypothetical protein
MNGVASNDSDGDDVLNDVDLCPGTVADTFEQWNGSQGRYMWNDTAWVSSGKGAKGFNPDMAYTYGCSGTQILDAMSEATGEDFGGHYKFGPSKSILEAWNAGEYHLGFVKVETLGVTGESNTVITTSFDTKVDTAYKLVASGTYKFADWAGAGIADASCSQRLPMLFAPNTEIAWVPGSLLYAPYTNYLELWVDGATANWGPCNEVDHTYTKEFVGTGSPFSFNIVDNAYGDNFGGLSVDVYEDTWVNLW